MSASRKGTSDVAERMVVNVSARHSHRYGHGCFALQRDARTLFREALDRCSVDRALAAKLHVGRQDAITLDHAELCVDGVERVLIVAMGKGAAAMLQAVLARRDVVGGREVTGILVAPERPSSLPEGIRFIPGAHPVANEDSRHAAQAILQQLRDEPASETTLCLFLISGGASSMVEVPLDSAIGIDDTAAFHRALVHSGAPIVQMNALRKHFSAVKGGRLALAAQHLRQLTLLMSDVPSSHLDALASGPTLPDTSTVADCHRILRDFDLLAQFPPSVRWFFERGDLPETPKPGVLPSRALLLLSQADLAQAAAEAARGSGYSAVIDNKPDDQPAGDAAEYLLERFRTLRSTQERVCLISTGEVTVRVPPESQGRVHEAALGGRNQHFVLECAVRFQHDDSFAVLSCGSDGVDGNNTAAGAVITAEDFQREEAQRRARGALACFDSGTLLRRMGCAVETGPTGLNLRDLRILIG